MKEITGIEFFEKLRDSLITNDFFDFSVKEEEYKKYIVIKRNKEEYITTFYQRYIDDFEEIIKANKTNKEITEKILE